MAKRNARTAEDVDRFQMERVFEKHDTNQQIFNEVGQLVGSAINGRNVCIFAYGQTGSGKTHTMNYPWNEPNAPAGYVDFGIIPRSVEKISDFINTNQGIWELSISGKYIEIYAEKVYDLLRVETSTVRGKTVSAAPEVKVMYSKDNGLLAQASSNRRTRSTKGNAQSSRSHSLLTLQISARRVDGKGKQKTIGLLNLIDLAGSEEPDINDKASQQEGININLSLSELRKVLGQMADPKVKNISFRGSVLTKLLQTSLGTGCKTMMFVMLSPLKKDSKDTRSTLQFAMTAQQAKLKTSKAPPR
ncbi:kinesin motor domain-containing protein [Truncatella angustata]|uniref:Kinesin motor domain-containing protein n=1 Tax=Truncatella angustata TaxID=152316 RepID=A0A9P8RPA0_9PEZI|nr:kinesin motor domain-containing protein [Truncatella angustata]KAH6647145.1 kinesin motor domain-containing protein [Truncatella angustata]